jgi:hypothetical protein
MKRKDARLTGLLALAGASAFCSITAAAAPAMGGVITFTGALLAPSFTVSAGRATGAYVSTAVGTQTTDTSGRSTYVMFFPEPTNPPNAELSLSVANARDANALTTSFRDGQGRIVKPGADGAWFVGALGGTLSMHANDDIPAATPVTIVTSYR